MRRRKLAGLLGVIAAVIFFRPTPSVGDLKTLLDDRGQLTFAPVLETVMPAVVSIAVKGRTPVEQSPLYHHPILERFGLGRHKSPRLRDFVSAGSGVVVDAGRGLVMTNVHTIADGQEIKVELHDGRELDAKLVGMDPPTDVALLRVEPTRLNDLPWGDSDRVRVGDVVFAIGSPFNLEGTATMGMVSAVMRSGVGYESYESYIQVDAAVNAGNSGGPLVNQRGELIGINTAILSPGGGNIGIGFAIPSTMARWIMGQLLAHGRVRRGGIGVRTAALNPERREAHAVAAEVSQGALIAFVQPGSPADKAGLAKGDVIVSLKGQALHTNTDFDSRLAGIEIGNEVELEVARGNLRRQVAVVVSDVRVEPERLVLPPSVPRLSGVTVASIVPHAAIFGQVKGVEVVKVPPLSRAALSGLAAGDIITKIDGYQVREPDDVIKLTKAKTRQYPIDVLRRGVPVRIKMR